MLLIYIFQLTFRSGTKATNFSHRHSGGFPIVNVSISAVNPCLITPEIKSCSERCLLETGGNSDNLMDKIAKAGFIKQYTAKSIRTKCV